MDLRILCMNTEPSYDVANAEFARCPKKTKYYYDKKKLVLNGKAQLNNILSLTGNCSSLIMPLMLIQGLEAELLSLRLHTNGLYVLGLVVRFNFPQITTTFTSDLKKMAAGLFTLRSICIDTKEKYMDGWKNKTKSMAGFTTKINNVPNVPNNDSTRPLWNPPSDTISSSSSLIRQSPAVSSSSSATPSTPTKNTR